MGNQIEQIRAEIEGRFWGAGQPLYGEEVTEQARQLLDFIDQLQTKESHTLVPESQEKNYKRLYEELVNSEWYKKYYQGASVGDSVAVEQPQEEEIHSLLEWAKIMAERPDLRAEFDKMCPPQPIQGSIAPEVDVDKWVVTNAFLHCEKAGKIVSEMYGDKLNNPRNRDKYLAFLQQVNLDDRFGELAEILQRYGAMPAPKEQPEADLEAEAERFLKTLPWRTNTPPIPDEYLDEKTYLAIARHFAEWGAEHLKK